MFQRQHRLGGYIKDWKESRRSSKGHGPSDAPNSKYHLTWRNRLLCSHFADGKTEPKEGKELTYGVLETDCRGSDLWVKSQTP